MPGVIHIMNFESSLYQNLCCINFPDEHKKCPNQWIRVIKKSIEKQVWHYPIHIHCENCHKIAYSMRTGPGKVLIYGWSESVGTMLIKIDLRITVHLGLIFWNHLGWNLTGIQAKHAVRWKVFISKSHRIRQSSWNNLLLAGWFGVVHTFNMHLVNLS